jgi:hypothetical protein
MVEAAAGAAAGAITPMGWLMAGSQVLAGALGGSGPAGPSSSDGNTQGYDNSGWVVQFGDGTIKTDRKQTTALSNIVLYVAMGIVGIVAIKWLKKKA